VLPLLIVACLTLIAGSSSAWQASGRFEYTDRLYDINGFTGSAARPVREADVHVYDVNSQALLGITATDANGDFSIAIADATLRDVGVRVLASTAMTPDLNLSVVDDLNLNAVYSYHDPATDVLGHTSSDVVFGTMTMPLATGAIESTNWSSQVFNIFDMGLVIADWVAYVDGARPAMAHWLAWNPTGERDSSYYEPLENKVYVSNDDGYDDPNILHELGHFVEDEYSHSSSLSGAHFIGDNDQDPRLAWSEGLATFFSNAALEQAGLPRPDLYSDRDSFGIGGGGGFSYTVETGSSGANGGATSELVVSAALWDIIDQAATDDGSPGTDDDPMSGLHASIWTVLETFRISTPANTQMADFWETWFSESLGSALDMEAVFTAADIDFVTDGQEPNDSPVSATALMVNGAYLENSFYRSGASPAGDEDWFSFGATAGDHYRISVNGANGAIFGRPDPEIFLLDSSLAVLAHNDAPRDTQLNMESSSFAQDMAETAPSILWRAPTTGSFLIYVRHASHRRNLDGRYGTYQIRVSNVAAPTPTVDDVAAQAMLPGQSYPVLILGDDFARDATVALQDPGIGVSDVTWLGPTAIVATLDVPPTGVPDGAYFLQVSNPGGGSGQRAAAIEVSAAAAPPVVISEVEVGFDRVEVRNAGTVAATLTGWQISSYRPGIPTSTFVFPSFTLAPGETVVVSEGGGADTAYDLYDQAGTVNWPWNYDLGGGVSLIDAAGRNVDFIRFVDSPVDDHEAPLGTGGGWLHPDLQAPPIGLAIARAETTSLVRTRRGLSWAQLTMPTGAAGRTNETDAFEDNDTPRRVPLLDPAVSLANLAISPRGASLDEDWFGFPIEAGDEVIFDALFEHASGNLDMALYAPGEEGTPLIVASSLDDDESIELTPALSSATGGGVYRLRIHGVSGATNGYGLDVKSTVCGDSVIDISEQCDDGNTADGDCCSSSCQYESVGASCEAVDACTTSDVCDATGTCLAGASIDCDDGNVCTDNSCDPGIGCVATPNTAPCDDNSVCTVLDVCSAGACTGGTPIDCGDANPCTDDSCDPVGGCMWANNAAPCDDGDACTEVDVCSGGSCAPGDPLDCDDANGCTDDSCNPLSGCSYVDNTLPCDDGDACSTNESCSAGLCAATGSLDCDDQNACTADSCDQISGCVNTPIVGCVPNVPLGSGWLSLVLATLLLAAGTMMLDRSGARAVHADHEGAGERRSRS
jgi:cysteine-rich repeat protein